MNKQTLPVKTHKSLRIFQSIRIQYLGFFFHSLHIHLLISKHCKFWLVHYRKNKDIIRIEVNVTFTVMKILLQRKPRKNSEASTGFEPMTSAIPVRCSTDCAMKLILLQYYYYYRYSDTQQYFGLTPGKNYSEDLHGKYLFGAVTCVIRPVNGLFSLKKKKLKKTQMNVFAFRKPKDHF